MAPNTPSLSKELIFEALRTIPDPYGKGDVVTAGRIQGLVVKDGHVGFAIEVDPADGARLDPLRKECEGVVYRISGVLSVTAVLTAHAGRDDKPADDADKAPPRTRQGPPPSQAIPGVKKIVAVASGKGGVGKSTLAANMAVALSGLGKRVGLLDADIYGPSVPRLLGLSGKPKSDGKRIFPMEAWGLKAMSIGFLVDESQAMIWRGPMVMSALTQMMQDVAWGELDILIVDMPPGTGDAQLTMAQRVPLTGAVMVSTPQEVALADVRRGIAMFEKTRIPILGLVENMAYFEDPASHQRTYIFGQGGVRGLCEQAGYDFLGEIPLVPRIRETSDDGQPIAAVAPDSAEARPFFDIAARLLARLEGQADRPPPRIIMSD